MLACPYLVAPDRVAREGFEVNATTEGLTKGIWLHHWQEEAEGGGSCSSGSRGSARGGAGGSAAGGECLADDGGAATLLLDSEGLGAPGSDLEG